jgi:hypothetical protein
MAIDHAQTVARRRRPASFPIGTGARAMSVDAVP